ncbi:DUF4044 domain-containing protein [Lactobacillus agrestimuris]|nr:DUF4044 domain-containing protein [Lactobacillus agrestimuris]MBD5431539.1 DUF4044 domain-containing protein [Lactobacillus sp.]
MARKRKKKSGFQKLTIIMALLMALVTLFGILIPVINSMMSSGQF